MFYDAREALKGDKVYVLAPNYSLAREYARSHEISPHRLQYISSPEQLRGLEIGSITLTAVGAFWVNDAWPAIKAEAQARDFAVEYADP